MHRGRLFGRSLLGLCSGGVIRERRHLPTVAAWSGLLRLDHAIDPLAVRLLGLQGQPELLAHHACQKAAHRNGTASRSPTRASDSSNGPKSWLTVDRKLAGTAAPS